MKTILVDAVGTFVNEEGEIFSDLHNLLDTYSNPKIILTNADYESDNKYGLKNMPYPVFTLKHNPNKADPEYYRIMLEHSSLTADGVVYFEHSEQAKLSAESVGIKTFFYDSNKKDLQSLKQFLDENLVEGE
jgi:FMN phosphatase YigB (HAD superfamily)